MQIAGAESHEVARVAAHIEGAEQLARSTPPRGLDRLRRIVRALLLEELAAYRREGVFPKNRDFPDRATPYFVDADGTRCAMAHLLELGGASALVTKIASERNNAFVRELADEPELLAWLDAAGLTVDEAARIQPSYCAPRTAIVCGGNFAHPDIAPNAKGVLEVRITGRADTEGWAAARVEKVHGDGAGFVVGSEVQYRSNAIDGLYVVPVYGSEADAGVEADAATDGGGAAPARLSGGVALGSDGIIYGGQSGNNDGHPVTAQQVADAYRSPNCAASVEALDPWWRENTCSGTPDDPAAKNDAGSSGASSSSGATTNPSGDDGGGCSTAGTDASAATLQILLALVGAVAARRALRARLSG